MSAVTVAGCGTQPQMSAKVSPRLLLWLSVSPTARVSCIRLEGMGAMLTCTRCQPVQGCLREGSAGEREGHFSVESQYSDSCLKRNIMIGCSQIITFLVPRLGRVLLGLRHTPSPPTIPTTMFRVPYSPRFIPTPLTPSPTRARQQI